MHDKLLNIGPLGVPTPEKDEKFRTMFVEFFAIMIIHIIRISVIVDTNGHNVRFSYLEFCFLSSIHEFIFDG